MKCFAHDSADAVGICKACGRGTCRACVTLVGSSVACSPGCAGTVGILNHMVQRTNPRMRTMHRGQGVAFLVLAVGCAVAGLVAEGVGRGVMLTAAVLCLLGSVHFFRLAAMYRERQR